MTPNQIHHKWNNREHKRPTGLGSNKISKRNQHMIIHESQIRQHIILRKPTHDNTWIYQPKQVRTGTILQQSKQGQSKKKKKTKQTHNEKNKTPTQIFTKMKLKTRDMRWGNKNPYLFLEDLKVKKCKNGVCRGWHGVFGWVSVEKEMGKTVNSHKKSREKLKKF